MKLPFRAKKQPLAKQATGLFGGSNLLDIPIKRATPMRRMGRSGTVNYGGYLQGNEDNGALDGRQRYKTFSEVLANCAIVAAGVRLFLNLVAKAEWKVEPAKDQGTSESRSSSTKAKEVADLVYDAMHDMETPWHSVVKRAAMYRFYGFSIQEWTAKRNDDGTIGLLDIEPRPQLTIERWDTDEHGKVKGVVQRSPQTQEELYLPRTKLVYLADNTLNDEPRGLGLLRHVADLARRLKRYEQLEGWGFETDMRGIPIARAPLAQLNQLVQSKQLTQKQADAMVQEMQDIIDDHVKAPDTGVLLDSLTYTTIDDKEAPSNVPLWSLEILKGDSPNQEAIGATIERLVREIARVLGVEHMLLGSDSRGSHALSEDKSLNFALVVDGTLTELVEQFEKDVLGPLFELNGWDDELKPTLKVDKAMFRSIETLTSALRDIAQAGAPLMPHDEAVGELFDLLGLTRMEREEIDPMEMLGPLANPNGDNPEVDEQDAEETPNDPANSQDPAPAQATPEEN